MQLRWLALALWGLLLASLTLTPQPVTAGMEEVSGLCLICGGRGTADALLNVALFLPLGFLTGGARLLGIGIVGILVSGSIEIAQLLLPGRYATAGDVLWNGVGTVMGAWAWMVRDRILDPSPHGGTLAALAVSGTLVAAGILLEPSWTREAYWGQWTADLGSMPQYQGRLLSTRLDDGPVPWGRFPDGSEPRARLSADFTLGGVVVKGEAPPSLSPIVSIYDGRQVEVVLLGADREDLVWRERMRANVIRLDQPDLRLSDALAGVAVGDTVEISVSRIGGERCLAAGKRRECGLGFTPGRSWSLLLYADWVGERTRRFIDAAWLLLLFTPIGLLSRGAAPLARNGFLAVTGVAVAVVATRLVGPTAVEWAAAVGGMAVGWTAAEVWRRIRLRAAPDPPAG